MRANVTTVCSSEAQGEIRAFLANFLESSSISDSEKNQIILAVDEAVANAIIHGHKSDNTRSIQIELDVDDKRITIEIGDIGLFDEEAREEKKKKSMREIIKDKQKGGLGLKLIYSIMDIASFYTIDGKSYCYLVKLFAQSKPKDKESKKDD